MEVRDLHQYSADYVSLSDFYLADELMSEYLNTKKKAPEKPES